MSLDFDLTSKRIRNLKVLQGINSNVFEIVEDVSHVALYKYETSSGARWERVDVEGSAFITRNKESPFYSLIVLNKKGPTDFVLDLTPKIKVKVQDIYVMIRCNAEVIIGLWFHDDDERHVLFQQMKRITSDGSASTTGGFATSLLKLQAQAAASKEGSPLTTKEPTEKLKYADIVKANSVSSPTVASEDATISPANCSAVKKNMLLSALRPSCSENELKGKAATSESAPTTTASSESVRPVGLSQSENNLGRLLLAGISSKKNPAEGNGVSDVKKVLFSETSEGVTSKNSSTESMTTTGSCSSSGSNMFVSGAGIAAVGCSGLDASDLLEGSGGGISPSSVRLLNLLKASGRNGSHGSQSGNHSGLTLNSSSSSNSTPVILSSQDSPVASPPQSTSPVNLSAGSSGAFVLTEAQRSDRLLAMLKHATTSSQAMDLLTDGDIANKVSKNNSSTSSTTTPTAAAAATAAAPPLHKMSSSDRLMSILKSGAQPSAGATPVPASNATPVTGSPLDKKLLASTNGGGGDVSASKENQLKNLLSINGVSPAKVSSSPATTPAAAAAAAATVRTASPSVVAKSPSEERTVNLLSSLAVVKRSPELKPLNSNTTSVSAASASASTLKSASPATVGSSAGSKIPVKPLLLSPSDLAKLSVA